MKKDVFQIKQAIPCTCGESPLEWEFEEGQVTHFHPMLPYTIYRKKVTYKCPACGATKEVHVDELAGDCSFPRIMINSKGEMRWDCLAHGNYMIPLKQEPDELVEALQNIFNDPFGLEPDLIQPCCVEEHLRQERALECSEGNTCIRCGMPDAVEELYEIPVQLESGEKHTAFLCCNCYEGEELGVEFCEDCPRYENEGCGLGLDEIVITNIEEVDGETIYTLSSTNASCDKSIQFSCTNDWEDRIGSEK